MLGVGLKEGTVKKITEKKVPSTILKKISSRKTKSFAEAVVGTKHGAPTDVVKVRVGEEEIAERLRKFLVAWWVGGVEEPR